MNNRNFGTVPPRTDEQEQFIAACVAVGMPFDGNHTLKRQASKWRRGRGLARRYCFTQSTALLLHDLNVDNSIILTTLRQEASTPGIAAHVCYFQSFNPDPAETPAVENITPIKLQTKTINRAISTDPAPHFDRLSRAKCRELLREQTVRRFAGLMALEFFPRHNSVLQTGR